MISTATARAFLGSPASDDTLVAAIIERATATLQRDLGFYLGTPASRTEIFSGSRLGLPPLVEIVVTDDVNEPTDLAPITLHYLDDDWDWIAIATNLWRREDRRFFHKTGFPCGSRNIRVSYRSGWEVDAGPGELRDLVLRMVSIRYADASHEGEAHGVQSETLSDYSYTLKDGSTLATDWRDAVSRYGRRLPV